MKKSFIFAVPLIIFSLLVVLFFVGLGKDPRKLPSPLIDKPAPEITLPKLSNGEVINPITEFKGRAWMLNVWASWCVSCRIEHPVFVATKNNNSDFILVGLNYQDDPDDARQWLAELGNPYNFSLIDNDGRVGIDWGVYAVPETFIIDSQGLIRYKHIGPISQQLMDEIMLPILTELDNKNE